MLKKTFVIFSYPLFQKNVLADTPSLAYQESAFSFFPIVFRLKLNALFRAT